MARAAERTDGSPACWACGGEVRDAIEFRPVDLVRCQRCGFLFQPERSFAEVRDLYGDDYFAAFPTGEGEGRREVYTDREDSRMFEAGIRARLVRDLAGSAGRLLEVGAAAGYFLVAARVVGFDAVGIEPSERIAALGRDRFGVDIVAGYIEEIDLRAGSFDVACAWHVVEHLVEPVEPLRRVRRALRPGGLFVAEVPNVESVRARRETAAWGPLDPGHHVGFYGPRSMRALLDACGFDVESVYTVSPAAYRPPLRRMLSHAKQAVVLRGWPFGPHPSKHELLRVVARARAADGG